MLPAFPKSFPGQLQDLTPTSARLCLSVERFLEQNLKVSLQGLRFVVSLSGGADSCALLLILHYLSAKNNWTLTAAHLDHGLRETSAKEAQWCQKLCESLSLPLVVKVSSSLHQSFAGLEDRARKERYGFLATVLSEFQGDWVCTGHQLNDLAEDVFMRLARGTGWPALGGMVSFCNNRRLLRPLLLTSRVQLESFLASLSLTALTDESNASDAFLRNRMRHHIVPFMENENPSFLASIANLWEQANIDRTFFSTQVPFPLLKEMDDVKNIHSQVAVTPSSEYAHLPQALRLRYFKDCLHALGEVHPTMRHLLSLDTLCQGSLFPKTVQFSGNFKAIVYKQKIVWTRRSTNSLS